MKPSESISTHRRVATRCIRCRNSIFVTVSNKDLGQIKRLLPGADPLAQVRAVETFCPECSHGDVLAAEAIRRLNPAPSTDQPGGPA
jgi:hypothetical protein